MLMVTHVAVGQAAVVKAIGVGGVEPDRLALISNRALVIATAGVKIAAMHVSRGVSGVSTNRLGMILHRLVEIALALPLIGTIAVDEREIAFVKPTGPKEARAGLDRRITGSPHAILAILRRRRINEASGRQTDQSGERPFSKEQHQTPPLFGQGQSSLANINGMIVHPFACVFYGKGPSVITR